MKRARANRYNYAGAVQRRQHDLAIAIRFLTTTAFLLGAVFTSWHQARASEAAFEFAQLELLLGGTPEDLQSSICRHGDEDPTDRAGNDKIDLCKHCPLCVSLQNLSAVNPPRNLAYLTSRLFSFATFLPHRSRLIAPREAANEARPRAPPLA